MNKINNVNENEYRAILVTLSLNDIRNKDYIENMDAATLELENLAEAANIHVLGNVIQNKDSVDVTYFIGKGKVEEIKEFAEKMDANLIIFNHEISGSQIRNLEKELSIDVIDRTMLILEIFAKRATTREGKLQVELAQLKYRLPRLIGLGNQLSRTGAGIGTRGPGEKKLETDRRHIKSRIIEIEKELKDIEKNRETQRAQRIKSSLPIVALVGYTNAGKSTIMNQIIKLNPEHIEEKEVFEKDMLFATLDTSLRKASFPNGNDFLLTDTVGFVSRLPHTLINAFKSTLEEVKYAHLLLVISDLSDPNYSIQKDTTLKVLTELGVLGSSILYVNNKVDKIEDYDKLEDSEHNINISARSSEDIKKLLKKIESFFSDSFKEVTLFFPYDRSDLVNELHNNYNNIHTEYENDGIKITLTMSQDDEYKYRMYQLS